MMASQPTEVRSLLLEPESEDITSLLPRALDDILDLENSFEEEEREEEAYTLFGNDSINITAV